MNKSWHIEKRILAIKISVGLLALMILPSLAHGWSEDQFATRPLFAYPLSHGRDNIVGNLVTYQIRKGDTLLDVGRWFGLSPKEVSDANKHLDWWVPKPGTQIILPGEHILPDTPHEGIVLNIPEMRLYYYYPSGTVQRRKKKKTGDLTPTAYVTDESATGHNAHHDGVIPEVLYTFPVGLGRFDWKTPVGAFRVTEKVKDPTWVVPDDIYKEHMERDGYAEHVIAGGTDDNPLGHYKLDLSIPEYGIHGTNVPWGVGMEVSHGCIRLYPEDIARLFFKVPVGTPGDIVYQPIKFGWRGDALYVEVHDDLYGRYPGLWNHALQLVQAKGLTDQVDMKKLEDAVVAKSGIPTYVMPGSTPPEDLTPGYAPPPTTTASAAGSMTGSAPAPETAPASVPDPSAAPAMAPPPPAANTAPVARPAPGSGIAELPLPPSSVSVSP